METLERFSFAICERIDLSGVLEMRDKRVSGHGQSRLREILASLAALRAKVMG
jgi:hypothetical protein